MDDEYVTLIFGAIILILIINSTAIWSVASVIYSPNNPQNSLSSPDITPDVVSTIPTTTTVVPTIVEAEENETSEPAIAITTPVPEITETPSIITIVTPEVVQTITSTPENYNSFITEPYISESEAANLEYVTIYSVENQIINNLSPDVSVNLKNPPLIMDFSITSLNITDTKYLEYKTISSMHYENVTIDRPYEDAWFLVTVTDKDTGKTVSEKGYGREYGLEPTQRLQIFSSGNYFIDFSGQFVRVTISMKVPVQGNFA
ncbi:MAG: hypothetical protein ABFC78_01515 [Methanoregula sp.]